MISDEFLDEINVDTALIDASEHEFSGTIERALALLSIGTDPVQGYYAAEEMASAVNLLAHDQQTARHRLAEILSRPGSDYQRALFYALAGRGIYHNSPYLNGLVQLMKARCDMWCELRNAGRAARVAYNAYVVPGGEGPRGQFDPDFELSEIDQAAIGLWDDVAAMERKPREQKR